MIEHVGKLVGNYSLTRLLGQGGFAEVYLGNHIHLHTQAAVKILDARLIGTEAERFRNEARLVAALDHPHIVHVLDFDVVHGRAFLVMDYAPHGSLRVHHPRGTRLPLPQIISYVKQIAAALQYAHNHHVIHRDIKPDNLLVGANHDILLSDFGIAVVIQNSLTQQTQDVAGTVSYMAPEQLGGRPCLASDQYALGMVVYEWLCGSLPFQGSLAEIVSQQMLATPPSLQERVPGFSPPIEAVVMKALAKDYHERFASVQEFAVALENACSPLPSLPTQPLAGQSLGSKKQRLSRRTVVLGLLGSAGIASIGGRIAWIALSHSHPTRTSSIIPTGTTLYTYRRHAQSVITVAWNPDGRRIASRSEDQTVQVWDAFTGDKAVIHRAGYGDVPPANGVAWSPDKRRIVSVDISVKNSQEDAVVQMWDSVTGEHILTHPAEPGGMAWSPNGKFIASADFITVTQGEAQGTWETLKIWDAMTGHVLLSYLNDALALPYIETVAWSPHGTSIAFAYMAGNGSGVVIWDWAANRTKSIYRPISVSYLLAITWSPDGQRIAVTSDKEVQIWNTATGQQQSTYRNHTDVVNAIAWSPDGKYIASASDDNTVQIWRAATVDRAFTYHGHAQAVKAVGWSPDGKYVASGSADTTVKVWQAL